MRLSISLVGVTITQWYFVWVRCFIPCSLLQTMNAPVEPPACWRAFSAEAGGLHFLWGGQRESTTSIGVYNVQTEQWTLTPTTGPPPLGLWTGRCAIIINHLYCFGGFDGSSRFNDLHKLNVETFQWSKVHLKSNSIEQPICKTGCGLIAVNERTLVCFGGYGSEPTHVQPGSTFTRIGGREGRTNEFHFFDTQEGIITNHHSVFSCICTVCLDQLIQSLGCSCVRTCHTQFYTTL